MLALRRLRCLLHSVPTSQTRYLVTQPREIPTYAVRWDPTRHTPLRPKKGANEPHEPRRSTPDHGLPKDGPDDAHRTTHKSSSQDIVIACGWQHGVKRLQHLLNRANAKDDLDQDSCAALWNAYSRAKIHVAMFPKYLPLRAREILWKSQCMDFSDMSRRSAHLAKLNCDFKAAETAPFAGQVAYEIEQKFIRGEEQQALEAWETNRRYFAAATEYLDVGVRIYALAGLPDQARAVMDHLLQLAPDWDLSVLIAVFRAYTSSDLEQHHKTAKELYSAIKARAGVSITIDTYDCCLVGFLEARSLPDAKEVFRDLVRDGCHGEGHVLGVDEVLRRLNLLYALGTDISRMTSIALDAIKVLPQAYHGHVFGDWMKSAVVEKTPQAAAQILDMMIHQGYEPESFHFNMLLRALFRTKSSPDVLKAENLGWKMIEEARLLMHKDRPAPRSRSRAIDQKARRASVLDPKPTIAVPAASVSTFALIMQHHAEKLQWEHVDYLTRQLKLANIEPNVTIMNVLIDNKCRQGKFSEAWSIYKSLTNNMDSTVNVFPNGASVRCLWKTLRIALADPSARGAGTGLPTPRELLRETIKWWTLCHSRYDADRFIQGLAGKDGGAITTLVLHCFSYMGDLPGSLVALHVLRHKFGIGPIEKVSEILARHIAWVDLDNETETMRMHFGHNRNGAQKLGRTVGMYKQIARRRREELNVTRENWEMYSRDIMMEVELDTLSEFVRATMLADYPPEMVELMIDAARKSVGEPDLPTGDMSAFEVSSRWT